MSVCIAHQCLLYCNITLHITIIIRVPIDTFDKGHPQKRKVIYYIILIYIVLWFINWPGKSNFFLNNNEMNLRQALLNDACDSVFARDLHVEYHWWVGNDKPEIHSNKFNILCLL